MIRSTQPCPSWCQLAGTRHTAGHFAMLAAAGETARVEVFQPEKDGVHEEPEVRLCFQVNGRNRLVEMDPTMAGDIADLIVGLDFQALRDIAAALRLPRQLTPKEDA
ncbi:hypothetical protein [Planomonospora parontospora]|uniref:hypothetical protein n=1 Tax=Planomonospora parontospora TaxID=58119 RepID=UPI0017829854|nr:hypothetical protein [Planomonospora parontospora]